MNNFRYCVFNPLRNFQIVRKLHYFTDKYLLLSKNFNFKKGSSLLFIVKTILHLSWKLLPFRSSRTLARVVDVMAYSKYPACFFELQNIALLMWQRWIMRTRALIEIAFRCWALIYISCDNTAWVQYNTAMVPEPDFTNGHFHE